MHPRLQELVDIYENGKEYIFRVSVNTGIEDETNPAVPAYGLREDVEADFVVSRDSLPLSTQFAPFYKGRAPARVPNFPMEMLFIELYKNGYDIAKIAGLCGVTGDTVNAYFAHGVFSLYDPAAALGRLTLAVIVRPEDEWAQTVTCQ